MNQETSQSSLYQRLGGIYPIAAVVDDFIDRIMVDPRLNANPLVERGRPSKSPRRGPEVSW